ncbi:transmembrane protein 26-like isoform X1 [Acanthaster planci]|uniref:Transmembrane protein 26-like isoform X1 n=1 Tax=Acanthaster planci TaxID=133434 RepID=A0A8B7XQU2_ACAPL|nr:transmembrane protein 26-like isoform X1 [Acanthaster planci]
MNSNMQLKKALRASVVRFCYLVHGATGIFLTVYLEQNSLYWFISILVLVYMIEMYVTFSFKEDGEWKWFFPLVLIYLATVLPVVWILEISLLDFRIELQKRLNLTTCIVMPTLELDSNKKLMSLCNFTDLALPDNEKEYSAGCCVVFLRENFCRCFSCIQITYSMKLSISTIYQQTLMLILILGRWLLPKGGLTRDELSQLLLVYIGMAADMLEFSSETLKLEKIACNRSIYVPILAVWSWSLLQFTLGLTSTKRRRRTLIMTGEETDRWTRHLRNISTIFCGTALWALMTDVILQDGPYLIMRLYLLFALSLQDQSLVFFTCKNALLLILQFYRLYVVMTETTQRATSRHQRVGMVLRHTRGHRDGLGLRRRKKARSKQCIRDSGTDLQERNYKCAVASISQDITILN